MKSSDWIYMILLVWVLASCTDEETLQPSYADVDRVATQIDRSNPVIMRWYEDYNSGVLYDYDQILDFAYNASSSALSENYSQVQIPTIKSLYDGNSPPSVAYEEYVQEAVEFLDSTLFRFLDPAGEIAQLMPPKILISASVFTEDLLRNSFLLTESDARYGSNKAEGALRVALNDHTVVLGFPREAVARSSKEYAGDNFYILMSRIMGIYNLHERLPSAFYAGKSDLYGWQMDTVYVSEKNLLSENIQVIDKVWFFSKGFIDADYFVNDQYGLAATLIQSIDEKGNPITPIIHRNAIRPDDAFVGDKYKDARSYLNQLIFADKDELGAYPANIKDNLRALRNMLTNLGVDMHGVNPAIDTLNY